MAFMTSRIVLLSLLAATAQAASPYPEKTPDTPANRSLQRYWELRTNEVHQGGSLDSITSAEAWNGQKD